MDIMIQCILFGQELKRVPWDRIAAVVVRGFEGRERDESGGLAGGEAGHVDGEVGAEDVNDELFVHVGIKGSKGVGDIDLLVLTVALLSWILEKSCLARVRWFFFRLGQRRLGLVPAAKTGLERVGKRGAYTMMDGVEISCVSKVLDCLPALASLAGRGSSTHCRDSGSCARVCAQNTATYRPRRWPQRIGRLA